MEVRTEIHRPIIAARVWGPAQQVMTDGLLDSGSDYTLVRAKLARNLGIDVDTLSTTVEIRSATGQSVLGKATLVPLQLARESTRLTWLADIVIVPDAIRINHWGFRGFMEYFRVEFDGPNHCVTLTPSDTLPVITPPS
jgi:hypothetical protein